MLYNNHDVERSYTSKIITINQLVCDKWITLQKDVAITTCVICHEAQMNLLIISFKLPHFNLNIELLWPYIQSHSMSHLSGGALELLEIKLISLHRDTQDLLTQVITWYIQLEQHNRIFNHKSFSLFLIYLIINLLFLFMVSVMLLTRNKICLRILPKLLRSRAPKFEGNVPNMDTAKPHMHRDHTSVVG